MSIAGCLREWRFAAFIWLVGVNIVSFEEYFRNSLVPIVSSPLEWRLTPSIWLVGVDVVSSE